MPSTDNFIWPEKDDMDIIDPSCVKQALSEPTCDRRGHLRFDDAFQYTVV